MCSRSSAALPSLWILFDALIECAARLCGATRGHIFQFDGEFLSPVAAAYGAWPRFTDYLELIRSARTRHGANARSSDVGPYPGRTADPDYHN